MRIRADRDDLADVFTRANRAVGSRSALPVLQGVLCDVRGGQVRVTGTDLEVTIRTSTEVEVLEEGSVVIPARLATEAIRRMPAGAVTIGATDTEIEILGRGPRFTLRPLALADFPDLGEVAGGGIAVDGDQLAAAIAQVTVAASTDAGRPILTGVLFESGGDELRLVATDSYRLAVRDMAATSLPTSALVPARGLRELARAVGAPSMTMSIQPREAVFASERGVLRLRLIEGAFPKYRSLLPENYPRRVVVEREAFLEALGRAALVAEDHIPVRLKLFEGGIEVTVTRQDVGGEVEHIAGEYEGEGEAQIAFNPRYLADGVNVIRSERVRLQVLDSMKPSVIEGVGEEEFVYVLMPVRV